MTNHQKAAEVDHLIDAVGHWQQDYDPKEDSEQYEFFGRIAAALKELQVHRKALVMRVMHRGIELVTREGLELIRDGFSQATDLEITAMAEALLSAQPQTRRDQ